MDKKLTNKLYKKYPKLYCQHNLPMEETCMVWGFDCDSGWFSLIDELSEKLTKLDPLVEAVQVKEKFGGLRFYIDREDKEIYNLIREYEEKSYTICEKCGKEGKLTVKNYWYKTLCKKCSKINKTNI